MPQHVQAAHQPGAHPGDIVAEVAHAVAERADEDEVAAQPVEADGLVKRQDVPQWRVPADKVLTVQQAPD